MLKSVACNKRYNQTESSTKYGNYRTQNTHKELPLTLPHPSIKGRRG